ncbi:MAG: hypothetical protein CUN55_01820 [Phototrophicales bacterium]|nr:MAG: hypothetical protein CUN55_01820 [Phototrophicales bacterium]
MINKIILGIATVFLSLLVVLIINTPTSSMALPSFTNTPPVEQTPSTDILVEQARLLKRAERPTAALFLLEQVILNPSSDEADLYRAYFLRGQLYQEQAQYELAIRDYSEAITLQPNLSEVYAFRATAFFAIADYEAAIADYDLAIEKDPSEPSYYVARGILHAQKKDYEIAIDDFTTALAIDDTLAVAYRERGLAAYAIDQISLATTDLQQYLRLSPNAPDREQIEAILKNLE